MTYPTDNTDAPPDVEALREQAYAAAREALAPHVRLLVMATNPTLDQANGATPGILGSLAAIAADAVLALLPAQPARPAEKSGSAHPSPHPQGGTETALRAGIEALCDSAEAAYGEKGTVWISSVRALLAAAPAPTEAGGGE